MDKDYQSLSMIWRNVAITVEHNDNWSPAYKEVQGYAMTHTKIIRNDKRALPITETGFRSHFMDERHLQDYDGILDFLTQWLDHDSQSKKWKAIEADQNQLKLF